MRYGLKLLIDRCCACALGLALTLAPMSMTRADDDTIPVALGSGSIVTVERSFERVLIGDPDVVDVRAQHDRSVLLQALKLGACNIVFVDRRSIAIANIRVVVRAAQI
jgi:Flp pilus assembly secretin CpaC